MLNIPELYWSAVSAVAVNIIALMGLIICHYYDESRNWRFWRRFSMIFWVIGPASAAMPAIAILRAAPPDMSWTGFLVIGAGMTIGTIGFSLCFLFIMGMLSIFTIDKWKRWRNQKK